MLLSDIDTWNVGALQSIAHELGGELATIEGVASDLEVISRLPGWDSPAADAARGRIAETTGKVLDDAAVIGAVQQLASETVAAVAKLHTELDAIRADIAAQGGYLTLSDNGDVTINAPPDMRDELRPIADNIESRAHALIHQASRHRRRLRRGLRPCGEGRHHRQRRNGCRHRPGDGPRPVGPVGAVSTRGPEQPHPATSRLGGRRCPRRSRKPSRQSTPIGSATATGFPCRIAAMSTRWRWTANSPTCSDNSMSSAAARTSSATPNWMRRQPPPSTPSGSGALQTRLDNAKAMKEALSMNGDPSKGYDPDRYLMLLEFPEGRDPRAAIAHGNPDTAEHVSVTMPGMDTHPTSLPGMVEEAGALRAEAQDQLDPRGSGKRAGRGDRMVRLRPAGRDRRDCDRGARRAPRQRSRT